MRMPLAHQRTGHRGNEQREISDGTADMQNYTTVSKQNGKQDDKHLKSQVEEEVDTVAKATGTAMQQAQAKKVVDEPDVTDLTLDAVVEAIEVFMESGVPPQGARKRRLGMLLQREAELQKAGELDARGRFCDFRAGLVLS